MIDSTAPTATRTNDSWCPNCAQSVRPTPGAFVACYIATFALAAVTLMLTAGTQYFAIGTGLVILAAALIFSVANRYYPEGACPICGSANLLDHPTPHS